MVNQNIPKVTDFATKGSTYVARQASSRPSGLEPEPSGSKVRRKFNFTKKLIDQVAWPTNGQRAYYYDLATRGLALAVSPAGKKVFVLYRKIAGKPERVTIGDYPDLTIEQARGKASELNGRIALGENPASKRRVVAKEATLGELFTTWLEHHGKLHKKTWADDEGMFNKHLNSWKVRKLSDIQRMDVVNLHKHLGQKSGPYTANRVVELLSSMFNKAIEWGWEGGNPATKIKAFREKKRERFLQPEELPAFFEALSKELNETIRDYILVALLTGARRSNVQEIRWEEINWPAQTWRMPETKNGESVTVPLSPQALSILESRKKGSKSEWVFPGKGKTGHLVEPKSAWKRILANAGLRDLRIHDLRRTLGSWQAAVGTSLPIIGKSLGHKSLGATQIYARLNLDPVRASVNKATDALMLAANGSAKLLENGNE